jgi:hypothetical protein
MSAVVDGIACRFRKVMRVRWSVRILRSLDDRPAGTGPGYWPERLQICHQAVVCWRSRTTSKWATRVRTADLALTKMPLVWEQHHRTPVFFLRVLNESLDLLSVMSGESATLLAFVLGFTDAFEIGDAIEAYALIVVSDQDDQVG